MGCFKAPQIIHMLLQSSLTDEIESVFAWQRVEGFKIFAYAFNYLYSTDVGLRWVPMQILRGLFRPLGLGLQA